MCKEKLKSLPWEHMVTVTNRHSCPGDFMEQIEKVCRYHPKAIILREKDLSEEEYEALAVKVLSLAREYGVSCRMHYFWELAKRMGEREIHLPLWRLREMPEEEKQFFDVIGTSIHAPEEAREAKELGSHYVTAGHVYVTDCKKGLAPRGTGFLKAVCEEAEIPVYGIGGIGMDKEQIEEVLSCGAEAACIMSAMMKIS